MFSWRSETIRPWTLFSLLFGYLHVLDFAHDVVYLHLDFEEIVSQVRGVIFRLLVDHVFYLQVNILVLLSFCCLTRNWGWCGDFN